MSDLKTDKAAQGARSNSGRIFEETVQKALNAILNTEGIYVCKGRESALLTLIRDQFQVRAIMDYVRIPVKRPCDQKQLDDYPDADLFVLLKPLTFDQRWRLLAIISCKTTFHSRHTESTFWAHLTRSMLGIPYVMVTEDGDNELGPSCDKSTKTRRILESFMTKIYLIKHYSETDPMLDKDIERFRRNEDTSTIIFDDIVYSIKHTRYCGHVVPFDDLATDAYSWMHSSRNKKMKKVFAYPA